MKAYLARVAATLLMGLYSTNFAGNAGIQRISKASGEQPFSFVYGGKRSADLLPLWTAKTDTAKLDDHRSRRTVTRTDDATGLEVRTVAVAYQDSSAIEWTVYLKNAGTQDTPFIENFQALDIVYPATAQDQVVLHHNVGSPADGTDYAPIETPLSPNSSIRLGAAGGRPTNSDLSYFNLSWGAKGEIIVVGWPAQWAARFGRGSSGIHVTAGQELTHLRLHPGEEVRSPLIVILPWSGDWITGQNLWRRWMMAYGMPKPRGKLPDQMMLGYSGRVTNEMVGANEANQIMFIDRYLQEGFPLDYWWMDAGWYVQQKGWTQVGTWEVDPKRFPNGLRAISDHAHARGLKTLLWFEPERVAPETWLSEHHPEWLLSSLDDLAARRSSRLGGGEPFVMFNSADRAVDWRGIHWAPHSLSLHPGPRGEYSVVRFTAPVPGAYHIAGAFAAIDPLATTDVHVLAAGQSLFDSSLNLNGHGSRADFGAEKVLHSGENIDLVVGYGAGRFVNDSTGLQATITGPDGASYGAANQFGQSQSPWSYGYLPPGPAPNPAAFQAYDRNEQGFNNGDRILNIGDPSAWSWLVERIDKLLVDNRIDLYRQDFNIDPLDDWRAHDAPDRQGVTENKYVVGYLAFWDELRRRHPNMLIDSCASGGRRNDLETMRRSVPLWRTDFPFEPVAQQGMTYGISMWLPYYGTGTVANGSASYYGSGAMPVVPYAFWSTACPSLMSEIDVRDRSYDYDALRRLWKQWKTLGDYFYSDYYPLTPFSKGKDVWMAWQFDRPDKGDGVIQAFRRPDSPDSQIKLRLRGLDPAARYRLTLVSDQVGPSSAVYAGKDLQSSGLPVNLEERPGSAVFRYERQ